jgi:hypothetical protein
MDEAKGWSLNMVLDYQKSRIEGMYHPDTFCWRISDSLPLALPSYYNIR